MGAFTILNPTIGGGTQFEDVLQQYLGQLDNAFSGRSDAALALINAMGAQDQSTANTLLSLFGALGSGQQSQQSTTRGILSDLLNQRLAAAGISSGMVGPAVSERAGRAGLAESLYSTILGAQAEARRSPLGFVDEVAYAQEHGTLLPLSQMGSEALTRAGGSQGTFGRDLQARLLQFLEPSADVSVLQQSALNYARPGPQTELEAGLMGALLSGLSGGSTGLSGGSTGLGTGIDEATAQRVFDATVGAGLVPLSSWNDIVQAMISATTGGGGDLQSTLIDRILATTEPGPAQQSIADIVQGFASQALPQGTVRNVFTTPSGQRATVILPSGALEIVNIPASGTGLHTVQGREGAFTVSLDDVAALLRRRQEVYDQQVGTLQGDARSQADAYLEALAQQQRTQEELINDQFRTASPSQRQDLINFIASYTGG